MENLNEQVEVTEVIVETNKVVNFFKRNKKKLIIGGSVVAAVVGGIFTAKYLGLKQADKLAELASSVPVEEIYEYGVDTIEVAADVVKETV